MRDLAGEHASACDGDVVWQKVGSCHLKRLRFRRRRRRRGSGRCDLRGRCVVHGIGHYIRVRLSTFQNKNGLAYLAIILPGNATLTVQSLPFVGWKTAVGFEVSTTAAAPSVEAALGVPLAWDWRFRFCDHEI